MEIITTTNALVTVAIMVTATNNNNTVPKKTDKSNSGHKSQETPRSPDSGV